METKHTKGEWEQCDLTVFPKGLSSIICTIQTRTTVDETEANAKLIASSPLLLEALIEARDRIIDFCISMDINHLEEKTYIKITNAIKKATS